jgi:sulfur-carrier protein
VSGAVQVRLPPVLRAATGGAAVLAGDGTTIGEVLANIAAGHPSLGLHLFDESGAPRRNIICLHAGEVVRARDFAGRAVASGDEIVLTNALAGG